MTREDESTGLEAWFDAIANYTYDWESWIDPDGRTKWVNPAVERITGYTADECLRMEGYPLPMVVPEDRPRIEEMRRAAADGQSGNDLEFRIEHKDGSIRWLAISWQSIYASDGTDLGYRSSVRDINERKRYEARLHEAMKQAEAGDRAKSELLANMSHELRSPVQSIYGYAQLLREHIAEPRPRRHVDIILDQSEVLLRLMDDLLQFASLEAHAPQPEVVPFDVKGVVERVAEAVRPAAEAQGLALSFEVEASVPRFMRGDPHRIAQVLRNLLGNAIKFTERGEVRLSARKDGDVHLVVQDTGIGMEASQIERLRQPFTQADASLARERGGVGLGLAICDRLCRAMGGELHIESEPGRGTRVEMRLPLEEAEPMPEAGTEVDRGSMPEEARRTAKAHPLRVLVVDDDELSRDLVVSFLKLLGYDPETAADGETAVRLTSEHPYDLVLMDLQMPKMDGLSATHMIRARHDPSRDAPCVIAMTANVFADRLVSQPGSPIDGFLGKPVHLADLRRLVKQVATGEPSSAPAETHGSALFADLDPSTLRELRNAVDGDGKPLIERIVGRLLEDTPAALERIRGALAEAAWEDAASAAHQVKGGCLMVGARRTAETADRLEEACRHGDGEAARSLTADLTSAWSRLAPRLRPHVRGAPADR
ncbi:MAG: ATP-binding protein [Myxococcota bacterium]